VSAASLRFGKRFRQRYCRNRCASPARSLPTARRNSRAAVVVRLRPSCCIGSAGSEPPLALTLPSVLSGVCCICPGRPIVWQRLSRLTGEPIHFLQRLRPDMVARRRHQVPRLGDLRRNACLMATRLRMSRSTRGRNLVGANVAWTHSRPGHWAGSPSATARHYRHRSNLHRTDRRGPSVPDLLQLKAEPCGPLAG
jgi:hypothetical protein